MRKKCRKIIVLMLLGCSIFLFRDSICESKKSAAALQEQRSITVGVPIDRCPVFYIDDSNKIVGIGAELMKAAALEAGLEVSFKSLDGLTLKEALDSEEYDIVMPFGSAIISASGKKSIVTANFMQTPFTLVTDGEKELSSLNNLRVGMLKSLGGAAETVHELYPGMEIILYDSMADSVKALRNNKVDCLLHNSYVWSYVLQKPSYHNLVVQPALMFSMDFMAGAIDNSDNRVLIDKLNKGISTLNENYIQSVTLDYTSRKLYRYDLEDYIYEYGIIAFLVVVLIVSILVIARERIKKEKRHQEEKLNNLINTDSLTGVLSMDGFRKKAEELIRNHPEIPYMISFNNINNFKFINDSFGWEWGDELLKFWTSKSLASLSEYEVMGRITGDRFAVLRKIGGDEDMNSDNKEIITPIRNFFIDRGKEYQIQICSGVYVLTPEDYKNIDIDRMLDFARVAEKKVKATRKDGFSFYNPEQWEKGKNVVEICNHLPVALKSGEIQVWYQPQIDYSKGKIVGAEALCRWNHYKLGFISPAKFIPLLEEAGIVVDLDSYVWEQVCKDLQKWNEQGDHRYVSVNLSRLDIREGWDIADHFNTLVKKYDVATDQLRIEITESAFADNPKMLIDSIIKLRKYGFRVEIDDFGSGYSSLHMLKEVPVDCIKLDLHFLSGTGNMEKGNTIIRYVIQMIKALGMDLIAEGVETSEQASFLENKGCSEMQGYFFYKPMTRNEFEVLF